MEKRKDAEVHPTHYETTSERKSERELVVTRTFRGPAHLVFDAWTKPELIKRWWAPESCGMSFVSCEIDARTGGKYRFVFNHPSWPQPMSFFGKYLEVIPNSRLVWTNEESGEGGAVTTVTFEEKTGETRVVIRDLYPSKQALDDAIASGSTGWAGEQFDQLDQVLQAQAAAAAPVTTPTLRGYGNPPAAARAPQDRA